MGQAQYDVYRSNVLSLAKSMVIKSVLQAQAINRYLTNVHNVSGNIAFAVDDADPTTWKYYLNLAGNYHPTDTLMSVISQDSLQTIDFTVANLQVNTATAAAYAVGGRYYNDLVTKYPTQSQLIRGILNPVDLTTAIAADDGTVLWMDPTLVESNEMNLAMEITRWAQYWFRRWNVPAYANVDDLYVAAMLGVMYQNLPHTILRIRQKNAPTYMAHSYHIGEYLESNGGLSVYLSSMSKAQMLWLRRNIKYLLRNAGKQVTFDTLVQHILTARGIPLSNWTMRHDTTTTQSTLSNTPAFIRGAVNTVASEGGIDTRTVAGMLAIELPMARDNADDADTVTAVTDALTWSRNDQLATKVLESSMLDATDATPYKLSDCLLNHWLYFATKGIYTAITTVTDPRTGNGYNFTPIDAFIVYMYAFTIGQGLPPLVDIPLLWANKVRKIPMPTAVEIAPYLTDAVDAAQLAAVFYNQPRIEREYVSIDAFNAIGNAIHQGELYQHALFSTQGHLWSRAELEFATLYLWTDYPCDLGAGQNYAQWFSSRNLDIPSLTPSQLATLADAIVQTATGVNHSTVETTAALQAAMLGIMRRLSSYTVQYIASINTSPLIVLERPSLRQGDTLAVGAEDVKVTIPQSELIGAHASGEEAYTNVIISDVSRYNQGTSASAAFEVDLSVALTGTIQSTVTKKIPMAVVGIQSVTDNLNWNAPVGLNTSLSEYKPLAYQSLPEIFTGLTLPFYTALTTTDQTSMLERYYAYVDINGTPAGLLSWYVSNTLLPPLSPLYP